MKATILLITAATFMTVKAQVTCSSEKSTVCYCPEADTAGNEKVCQSWGQTTFVDTDGITKCKATGAGGTSSWTECVYSQSCVNQKATCE
ncbi:hypothetical protein LZ31DRAFT_636069 [Colletotrichum somersetense]|nr:hypothetical protein LZ31DRAFT_636069 [Colletotrichum somersetense]